MRRTLLIWCWLVPGWLVGLAAATYPAWTNLLAPPFDSHLARLYIAFGGAGLLEGALAGLLVLALVELGARLASRGASGWDLAPVQVSAAVGVWAGWILYSPTTQPLSPDLTMLLRGAALAALVGLPPLVYRVARREDARRIATRLDRRLRPAAAGVCLLALGGFAALVAAKPGLAGRAWMPEASVLDLPPAYHTWEGGIPRDADRGRLVLLGLDGLDWRVVDRVIARGGAPHLARLKGEGAWGPLASAVPTSSPLIWTTILTGRPPEEHGVLGFDVFQYARLGLDGFVRRRTLTLVDPVLAPLGGRRQIPISSRQRRVKALWNLCSEAGLRVAALGWWASWPAEPVNGFLVSDQAAYHFRAERAGGAAEKRFLTFPEGLMRELAPYLVTPDRADASILEPFVRLDADEKSRFQDLIAERPGAGKQRLRWMTRALSRDGFIARSALHLADRYAPEVLLLYLHSFDAFAHMTWEFDVPGAETSGYPMEDLERFRGSMDRIVTWLDGWVGELLDRMDGETTLVVVSDHGWNVEPVASRDGRPVYGHGGAPPGVFLAAGHGVAEAARVEGARLIDVAPTLLYLLGVPLSEELGGRVLDAAIDADFQLSHPRRTLATYEAAQEPEDSRALREDARMLENLRGLGYIE